MQGELNSGRWGGEGCEGYTVTFLIQVAPFHSILLAFGLPAVLPPFPGLKLPILLNPRGTGEDKKRKCLAEHAVCVCQSHNCSVFCSCIERWC